MRILGIDPGSLHTGYGVVDRQGSRLVSVAFGRLSPPRGRELPERLAWLARGLEELIAEHRPQAAVLESMFHGRNVRSLIVLAQARGALLAVLARHGLPVSEYSPAEVKSAVTGNGRAGKEQVARMVRLLLALDRQAPAADAADALAAAICAAQRLRMDRLRDRQATGTKGLAAK